MNRREFLGGLAFLGCQGLALNAGAALSSRGMMLAQDSPAASAAKKGKFDDDTVVFISDLHIKPGGWQPEHLVQTINDILNGSLKTDPKSSGGGIGLDNVIARLRLFTGESDPVSITSEGEGKGTRFDIYLDV